MNSLESLKNIKREAGFPYFSTFYDIDMWKEDFEIIKRDLEILELIIKWKSNIYLKYDFEYLDKEESVVMQSELKLIENYLSHHFGYMPKCFKQYKGGN